MRVADLPEVGHLGRAGPHLLGSPHAAWNDRDIRTQRSESGDPGLATQNRIEEFLAARNRPLRQDDDAFPRLQPLGRSADRGVGAGAPIHPDTTHGAGELPDHRCVEHLLLAEEPGVPPRLGDGQRDHEWIEVAAVVRGDDHRTAAGEVLDPFEGKSHPGEELRARELAEKVEGLDAVHRRHARRGVE